MSGCAWIAVTVSWCLAYGTMDGHSHPMDIETALDAAATLDQDIRGDLADLDGALSCLGTCDNADDALTNLDAAIDALSAMLKAAKKAKAKIVKAQSAE